MAETKTHAKAGHDCYLVARGSVADEQSALELGFKMIRTGGANRISRIKRLFLLTIRTGWYARSLRCDVYHFHDPELMPVGLALKTMGYKVIMDVHEDFSVVSLGRSWIPVFLRARIGRLTHGIERLTARRLDAVVCATPRICRQFSGAARQRLVVANYPLLAEFDDQDLSAFEHRDTVAYVGGVALVRGIDIALRACAIAGKKLVFAGPFLTESEYELLSKDPAWAFADYRGVVDRRGVAEILGQAKLGIFVSPALPNVVESLPIKLFEYMAAGIPVIVSNFPVWREIVEGAQCGICVEPGSDEEVAAAIRLLFSDHQLASRMGRNGRQAVLERYRWDTQADKLAYLYREFSASA